MRWQIVDTWNGGKGGSKVVYISKSEGNAGHNECFKWIHDHTSFSFHEATTNQGYKVEPTEEILIQCNADGCSNAVPAGTGLCSACEREE